MKIFVLHLFLFLTLWGGSLHVGVEGKSYPCMAYFAELSEDNSNVLTFVTDFNSGDKLNPHKAFFVLNSQFHTTCSKYPIVAFKEEKSAHHFTLHYGGNMRDFDFALAVATHDLTVDAPIMDARKSREILRGKMIFSTLCRNNPKQCPMLRETDSAALHAFLENRSSVQETSQKEKISVPIEAKCPVCGMFVHKHSKWTSQIVMQNSHSLFFDGVKDMMKFYFEPSLHYHAHTPQDFTHIFVSDYYTLEKTEAKEAFFVAGSNVYGPMGHELIPFKNEADARAFSASHNGKHIYPFHKLSQKIIWSLDQ
ncbi:MAG: nitrous oxide reductase accessory protein NosL [Sulfuricurvum sp.]